MKAGTEMHQVLEESVMGPPVEFTEEAAMEFSAEDAHALRLGDVVSRWRHLVDTSKAREISVYGTIRGIQLKGVIDEAAIDEKSRIHLVDTKTYAGDLAVYKQRLAYHQLLVYYELMGQMIKGKVDIDQLAHEKAKKCDFLVPLHRDIQAAWGYGTLQEMMDGWKDSLNKLSSGSMAEEVRADFIDRRNHNTDQIEFKHDVDTAEQLFAFRSELLSGQRPPLPLSRSVGSCRFCPHFADCSERQH